MANSSSVMRSTVVALVVLALATSPATAIITCQEALTKLLPCRAYLVGNSDISPPCCDGAQSLNQLAKTKEDRQAVCECFKKVAPGMGVKLDRAQKLPELCHISIGVPIDFSIDCSKVLN